MKKSHMAICNKVSGQLREIIAALQDVLSEMEGDLDAHSEKWRESEAGEEEEARKDSIEEVIGVLEEQADALDQAVPADG